MRSLPSFVYESLPYLYLVVGAVAMTKVSGKLGLASGLLMVCLGLLIFKMRRTYRAEAREGARITASAHRHI